MHAGEMDEQVEILSLGLEGTVYSWEPAGTVWAKAEREAKNNLFSDAGLGAKSVKFAIRQCGLTLASAMRWRGQHCFLTDIADLDREFCEVRAALIEPRTCTVVRKKTGKNELNRLVLTDESTLTFPACVTEKYMGHAQTEPMAVVEVRYILVTPKDIALESGEIVTAGGDKFAVLLAHTLDAYKNEYEIMRKAEP